MESNENKGIDAILTDLFLKITKLIDVKTLITLPLVYAFIYMTLTGISVIEPYKSIMTMVLGFYFGAQSKKNKN